MSAQTELDFTADEQSLQQAMARTLRDASPVPALTQGTEDSVAIARRHWALAVEMGWHGLLVPEQMGGVGLGLRELAVLCEEMGRHFYCGPFLATAVLGTAVATLAERQGKMAGLSPAIASGKIVLAAAAVPPSGVWISQEPSLTFGAGVLSGAREVVEHLALATHILAIDLTERKGGAVELLAALVPAGRGVTSEVRQGLDVSCPIASIRFKGTVEAGSVLRLPLSRDDFAALTRPVHVAIAAELTGVAQAALDGAVNYAKTREQFGKPIGSFQAIKHKLADVFVATTNARLAVRHAASTDDASSVEAARVLAADAALKATADYIQIQGGMGISWESEAHLYLKRTRRLAAAYGDTEQFRRAIADRFIASVLDQEEGGRARAANGSNNNAA
jgi:alkylation response protein AidB-like acyl-CoA dehydrogenase